jgi:hypothetical protein
MPSVPQNIALNTAAQLAVKNAWPPGLLEKVNTAIRDADPEGVDYFAAQADWWQAVANSLTGPAWFAGEAELLRPLVEVAQSGGQGARPYTVGQAAQEGLEQLAGALPPPKRTAGGVVIVALGAAALWWSTRRR